MSDQPNILLIMTDQQALSTMQTYGETICMTPNLDALANESTVFTNHFTTCPLCSPARASIMTGMYPHGHGVTANVGELGCAVNELPDLPHMLSRKLERAGYQCGYIGKWHLGTGMNAHYRIPSTPSLPKDLGFAGQNFPGHGGGGFNYPEYRRYLQDRGLSHHVTPSERLPLRNVGVLAGPVEATIPYFLTENTISLLDQFTTNGNDQPFFIWHNFWGPHEPYYATQEYLDMYADIEIPPWPNYNWRRSTPGAYQVKTHPQRDTLSWSDWEVAIKHYYAFMTMIDDQIGRLMNHLKQTGLYDNTVVIFTSDHGETLGTHGGMMDKGFSHFEEIQHIPLLTKAAKGQSYVEQSPELTSLVDMYPTILELAGAELDPLEIHGRSLLPLIQGEPVKWRDSVVCEFHGLGGGSISLRTIRKGAYKYGFSLGGPDELYDLAQDPHEMLNLIEDPEYSQILEDLKRSLLHWMKDTQDGLYTTYRLQAFGNTG